MTRVKNWSWLGRLRTLSEDTPIMSIVRLVGHQLFGWHCYLLFSATAGRRSVPPRKMRGLMPINCHSDPMSAFFLPSQGFLIILSDVGLLLICGLLYLACRHLGVTKIVLPYFIPYFWIHHWLGESYCSRDEGRMVQSKSG